MRSIFASLALVLVAGVLTAQTRPELPGQVVISPKGKPEIEPAQPGTIAILKGIDPDHPGFIVFVPNKAQASKLLPAPNPSSKVETVNGVPSITIIGSTPKRKPEEPMLPGGNKPKPAEPEKVEDGKLLRETYDVAYCRDCKVGYQHTVVRQYERNGKTYLFGTRTFTFQIARFGQVVEQWTEEATLETEDGQILTTSMRQGLGKNAKQELRGEVTAKGLEVTITGEITGKEIVKWPEGVLGIAKEATLFKDMKPKPGVTIEYKVYFGQFNGIMSYKLTSKGTEEVVVNKGDKPKKMLKVIQEMVPQGEFRMPATTIWHDPETFEPMLLELDMPMLGGTMTAKRTSREVALAKPAKYLDLGEVQSIPLPNTVPGMHDKASATFSFQLGGDVPLEKAFANDSRQTVTIRDAKTRSIEIDVKAIRAPQNLRVALAAPGKEYLSDSYFIDWNHDLVKKHAASAVAGLAKTAGDWEKAQAVELWVRKNMKQVEFSQAMAPCFTVAKELSGDCTEHAMLATGMCRALGIPAKTALGLVYAPAKGGNAQLAYHMWFEVWADNQWLALDAILGQGSVGPGHIKITEAHWDGEKGITPIFPVMNILGSRPVVTGVK